MGWLKSREDKTIEKLIKQLTEAKGETWDTVAEPNVIENLAHKMYMVKKEDGGDLGRFYENRKGLYFQDEFDVPWGSKITIIHLYSNVINGNIYETTGYLYPDGGSISNSSSIISRTDPKLTSLKATGCVTCSNIDSVKMNFLRPVQEEPMVFFCFDPFGAYMYHDSDNGYRKRDIFIDFMIDHGAEVGYKKWLEHREMIKEVRRIRSRQTPEDNLILDNDAIEPELIVDMSGKEQGRAQIFTIQGNRKALLMLNNVIKDVIEAEGTPDWKAASLATKDYVVAVSSEMCEE